MPVNKPTAQESTGMPATPTANQAPPEAQKDPPAEKQDTPKVSQEAPAPGHDESSPSLGNDSEHDESSPSLANDSAKPENLTKAQESTVQDVQAQGSKIDTAAMEAVADASAETLKSAIQPQVDALWDAVKWMEDRMEIVDTDRRGELEDAARTAAQNTAKVRNGVLFKRGIILSRPRRLQARCFQSTKVWSTSKCGC